MNDIKKEDEINNKADEKTKKRRKKNLTILSSILGAAIIFIIIGSIFTWKFIPINPQLLYSIVKPTATSENDRGIEALACSRSAVEKQLKTLLNAKFPNLTDKGVSVTDLGGNRYLVFSYVDSENSSGAMIRTTYSVIITLGENNNYKYKNLNINE